MKQIIKRLFRKEYRVVACCYVAEEIWYEVERLRLFGWRVEGDHEMGNDGLYMGWHPYRFATKEDAERYIRHCFEPKRISNTPISFK